jgi:uncharacterized protein
MDKYALAKLVQWAGEGGIQGRKRLQKVVYFLQHAGCPTEADYFLHYYGPYSRDVAETCDQLVSSGLLEEHAGTEYAYTLTNPGRAALAQTDERLGDRARRVEAFQPLAAELVAQNLWHLELGSTILFFRQQGADWDAAVQKACTFKRIDSCTNPAVAHARALAERVVEVAARAR